MPAAARGAGVGEAHRLAADGERAAVGPQAAEQRARQLELAAAHEAVDAEDLAAARREAYVAVGRRQGQASGFEHDRRRRPAGQLDLAEIALFQLLAAGADHSLDDPALVDRGRHRRARNLAAVAKNRDLVGDLQDVLEKMRDEDEAASAALELDQHFEQPLDFRRRQGGGRLVEDDDPRAGEQHAGKLDELLHADRKIAEPRARVDVEPEIVQLFARLPRHPAPGDEAQPVDRLHAEEDIFGDGELRRDRKLLMHHADAGGQRVARGTEMHFAAVDAHLPLIAGVDAGDDLHQRALAGAVLPDETVNLAGVERKIDGAQGLHAAERLGYAGEFEERRPHRRGTFARFDQIRN